MSEQTTNDNDIVQAPANTRSPDAHGQAAMLLVESLIHGLVARSVLSVSDAVEIVDIAAEVKEEVAADMGDTPATMEKSLRLLATIGSSLRHDIPRNPL